MKTKEKSNLNQKNNLRPLYIAYACICVALLAVAAVWDLDIDKAVNNTGSYFGQFLARFGEIPAYLVMPFGSMVFFSVRDGKPFKTIFSVLLGIAGWIYLFIWFGGNWFIDDEFTTVFSVVLGLIFTAVSLFIASKLPRKQMKRLQPFAVFIMIATLGAVLTTEGLKNIWGRVRFRDLLKAEDFSEFTAWYLPQGVTGNKSFPSGHTTAAAVSLQFTALPLIFNKLKKYETRIFIITAIYTFMVGFSRLIVGAHYLSDIVFGAVIGFAWYLAIRKLYLEKKLAAIKK